MQCLTRALCTQRAASSSAHTPRTRPVLHAPPSCRFLRIRPTWRDHALVCASADPPPPMAQTPPESESEREIERESGWARWQSNAAEMRARVAKLGLAAVLAYGLFDGITYTTFFVLAFLGYEKSSGQNPAANIQALLGIVLLMWTGNNVTRPLRVAGAAALAPIMDKALRKIQRVLNLPNQVFAFMVVVATFAALCLSVVGLLILSRCCK